MRKRVFENPIIGDRATLVRSAEETGGEFTLFQIEVIPGGGNALHTHEEYTEQFDVVQGELTLQIGRMCYSLRKGESMIVQKKELHRFTNKSSRPVRFNVEFRPAQPGFERAIAIGYGLAADGLVNKKSIPQRLSHLAILMAMSGTTPAGFGKFLLPFFRLIAHRYRKTEATLINRYC